MNRDDRGRQDKSQRVDVVIPTRGRGALIDVTIASIRESDEPDFALWVVDQSDDERTQKAVLRHASVDSRVHYLHLNRVGSDIGRNAGAAAGCSPYILFTDDDCRVAPGWMSAMMVELEEPNTWAVFGRVTPEDCPGEKSRTAAPVHPSISVAAKTSVERQVYQGRRFNLGFGHGASMGLRRDGLARVGGFDELLGAGGPFPSWPERDIGYRILRMGGTIVYTPNALVYHRHWRDWHDIRLTYRNYGLGAGASVGKYVRCGDLAAWYLLFDWILDQGVRQVFSGLLKRRSWQKATIGLLQLWYPWVGLARSWRQPIDREKVVYVDRP